MRPWATSAGRDAAWRRATDPNMNVADVISEGVADRRLDERPPSVVRPGHVCSTRLPGDVHRSVGTVYGDRRLSRVALGLGRDPLREALDDVRERRHREA